MLHANVAVPAHARGRLEHLCRCLLRPPLAQERLTESSHGRLLLRHRACARQAALESLVNDDRDAGLFRVHRSVFTEPHVLELERQRVFDHCWIYADHASEVPRPGDFQARRVAGRPVILVRGMDGVVRVLLNTCTHRGAQVCRETCGNTRSFQCFYHAWPAPAGTGAPS